MEKLLIVLATVLALAACERTGNESGKNRGKMTTDGISAVYDTATDMYAEYEGMYMHVLVFSNAETDADIEYPVLEEGERADMFMLMFLSDTDEFEAEDIQVFDLESIIPSFPSWVMMYAVGLEGTGDPENPKELYSLEGEVEDDFAQPSVNVAKSGTTYTIHIEGMYMYNPDSGEHTEVRLEYEGPVISVNEEFIAGLPEYNRCIGII